jgi:glycosyltransferase involved in cell wall biosynthesis
MSAGNLLVLQDSQSFGGHEAMFLRFLPRLIDSGAFRRIAIRFAEGNVRLRDWFVQFGSPMLDAHAWPFVKRRAEPYLAPFRRDYAQAVRELIATERPTSVLLLQGRIENLVVPMLAAPPETFLISYIPMAHRMAELGRAAIPGDMVRRRLYRRPDRFIVPSSAVASQVHMAGGGDRVVVDNIVSPPPRPDRAVVRAALNLPVDRRIALLLGRLDIRQKGLDRLSDAIRRRIGHLGEWTFLIVGDGPGRAMFEALAAQFPAELDLRCIAWTDSPHAYLAAADLLLMPSRWEGVPLVMLEALAYGVPVLGSDIDVFREYLPERCRIDFTARPLEDAMNDAIAPEVATTFARAARDRTGQNGLATSADRFIAALQR